MTIHTVSNDANKSSECLTAQTLSNTFDRFYYVFFIKLLCNFELPCETNGIKEGITIRFTKFLKK